MNSKVEKIGLGGSCHWCTEAIFQSLCDVIKVDQGWIAPIEENDNFSEAVIVHFLPNKIGLLEVLQVHLHTHSSTANHSFRKKYRSAIYTFNDEQSQRVNEVLKSLQVEFDEQIITRVMRFSKFKENKENYLNYYYEQPERPFCQNIIVPKLRVLLNKFSSIVNTEHVKSTLEKNPLNL